MTESTPGLLTRLAQRSALMGMTLLCLLAAVTLASIAGRNLLGLPLPGDFEIVAMGTAISVLLCLPWCQLARGQIRVDLILERAPRSVTTTLDAIGAALCGLIAITFAWRMSVGMLDALRDRDVTVILSLPLWWAYPFAIFSFALLAACCLATAAADLREA